MTNEEAKFILQAYRSSGADADDPAFTAALEQARRDPALQRWFAAQQAFDRAMTRKLGELVPPTNLRAAILAGARASAAAEPPRTTRAWWRSPVFMATAASLALFAAVGLALWPQQVAAHEGLLAFAMQDTLHADHEGQHGADAAQFQALLSSTETRLGAGVPLDFAQLRARGCRVIQFQGRDLLEVCFSRDGKWFHCYVARAADFPALAAKLPPQFRDEQGVAAAAWADGQHIFVVASKAGREAISRLL